MDHKSAHDGLRKIRYWAARHTWKSDHDTDGHDRAQIENITAVLGVWRTNLFDEHQGELICLLLDAKDNAKGIWRTQPLLVSEDKHIRDCLSKYFYLVQAFPNTIPGVQGFFFHRLNWPHGILTFQIGLSFDSKKISHEGVISIIGPDSFEETLITMPKVENSAFYDRLHGYDSNGWVKGTLAQSPLNQAVTGGVLETSADICGNIWGSQAESCKNFVKRLYSDKPNANSEPCPSDKDIERGMWVLANMSWFLSSVSREKAASNYHYYFFRALPNNRDDFFHTSGQGLLGWASPAIEETKEAAGVRQAIALTACLTLSRLSDAALPFYQKRAVTQEAQIGLGQKMQLMWALDNLVLPAMLGATIKRQHFDKDIQFGFENPFGVWRIVDPVPQVFKGFVDSLWPIDPWRPQCGRPKDQLHYLLALIKPLGAEGVPHDIVDSFSSIVHDIKRIPTGISNQEKEKDKRSIIVAQTRLAAAGALFVPAQKTLNKVHSAFKDWAATTPGASAVDFTRKALDERIREFSEEFTHLGKLRSLNILIQDWNDDVVRVAPCGRSLADDVFPVKSLPFYITDLDLAYRALRDNWEKGKLQICAVGQPASKARFHCCVLPNNIFVIYWREEPGWCANFHSWSEKMWESMDKEFASSRGLPFVLRFAAQNSAAHLWVRTNDGERTSIIGEQTELERLLPACCEGCPINSAPQSCYEVGMVFKAAA